MTPAGRVAILVSRYHERITTRLLEGAQQAAAAEGIPAERIDVHWVAGAFELGVAAAAAALSGRYRCLVALGVVVRGETPHFEYVAGATAHALAEVARAQVIPVGFGLLTTDTLEQAASRAGGGMGNKGAEAMRAALDTAGLVADLLGPPGGPG
jgi:6,7-dimethyl-8-ribityllumazine synthase